MPLALVLAIVLAVVVLIPLSLILRYRAGTVRRRARAWLATLNVVMLALSSVFFLVGAAVTNVWVPSAFAHACAGLVAGLALGLIGLAVSRWERSPGAVHYTPNRWLVLALTLAVTARLGYGIWRGWQAWTAVPGDTSWLAESGVGGSLAAGSVVLGYYLSFWAGVRRRALRT